MLSKMYENTNAKKMSKAAILPWVMWGLAAAFYLYENCLQVSPGVMVPELMRTFAVDAAALGNLAAFYFYSYASMQIPVGVLLDRYGPRRLLLLATSVCVMGSALFGIALSLKTAGIGRLLIGFGSAFAVVSCMKLATNWFPAKRFALLTGLTVTIGLLGSILGETPLALMVTSIGWRQCMLILAGIGAVLFVLIWLIMRDKPKDAANDYSTTSDNNRLFQGLGAVLKSKRNWITATYGGLMFAPTSIFGALWGVPFLMEAYHLERPVAAGIISMLFWGWVFGSPLLGLLSDYIGRRKPTLWIASIGGLITLTSIIYIPNLPSLTLSILLFAFGFCSSGFLPSFSIMREINSNAANATALGFMNMLNMVGGALGQPFVGLMLDQFWTGTMVDGVRMYSLHGYHIALALLPIMIGISLFIIPFTPETFGRSNNHTNKTAVTS